MKKFISFALVLVLSLVFLGGCGSSDKASNNIHLVSREDGSGTRGAFVEIVGILEVDDEGNEVDKTYIEATIQNGTNAVMTTVAGDEAAIGYISLGSLNDTVKAVKIDDVRPSAEAVQDGSYKIARPFNIGWKSGLSDLGKDFLDFILSEQGQEIVINEGFVQFSSNLDQYTESSQEGKIVIAGSTSVSPVMEKLAEAYEGIYSGVSIEIQSTGSSAGMTSAIEGAADIGMASRELKDSEKTELEYTPMAIDGIAVIVNNESSLENLSLEEVKEIFTGVKTNW